jgi:TraM recognition site of TraD and TraG
MLGSLLVAGLWAATTRRATRTPQDRPDATIILDEFQNLLRLPIGVDEALAESRGYRVSWVLAHQNRAQLPSSVREAIDANTRTKVIFTVSPSDARELVEHFAPYFCAYDLTARPSRQMTVRTIHQGHELPPFSLNSPPIPGAIPGRAERLCGQARARTGLTAARRHRLNQQRDHRRLEPTTTATELPPRPDGPSGAGAARTTLHPHNGSRS